MRITLLRAGPNDQDDVLASIGQYDPPLAHQPRRPRECHVASTMLPHISLQTAWTSLNSGKLSVEQIEFCLRAGLPRGRRRAPVFSWKCAMSCWPAPSSARGHPAEIAADCARPNESNPLLSLLLGHAVITEINRSMSRSVLYRYGDTRMLPSRMATITFSLRSF
jgi:hypothetical protein